MLRRIRLISLVALWSLSSCRDVVGPEEVAGVYVLERVGAVPMPGEIVSATYGSYRVFYDTLVLRSDQSAYWSRHSELLPAGASVWVVSQGESEWSFTIRADEIRLRGGGCPVGAVSCIPSILSTKLRLDRAHRLWYDSEAGRGIYSRVSAPAP
jgi:hypothetical protein